MLGCDVRPLPGATVHVGNGARLHESNSKRTYTQRHGLLGEAVIGVAVRHRRLSIERGVRGWGGEAGAGGRGFPSKSRSTRARVARARVCV